MRKFLLAAIAIFAAALTPALADGDTDRSGHYISLNAGGAFNFGQDAGTTVTREGGRTDTQFKAESTTGWDLSAAFGRRNGAIAYEVEGTYGRSNTDVSARTVNTTFGETNTRTVTDGDLKGAEVRRQVAKAMLNVRRYFTVSDKVEVYGLAGAGAAYVETAVEQDRAFVGDGDDWAAAYQAGVGLEYKVARGIAVETTARYQGTVGLSDRRFNQVDELRGVTARAGLKFTL